MKKVLLIGPNFYYFIQSIERAFRALGWDVCIEIFDNPIHPYTKWNKVRYKLSWDKATFRESSRNKFSKYLKEKYLDNYTNIDLVFVLNGNNLNTDVVQSLSAKTKVVFWLFDSITRFPELQKNLRYAYHVFCYERTDIPILATQGINADFLPQSVDTTMYFKIPNCEKKYDIVFAGDIYASKKRQKILASVVRKFPNKRMLFVGQVHPWYKNPWKWLIRKNRDIYTNKSMSVQELNVLYNSARIVLNIHNEQQVDGANPKVYEIAASGAYQICDYHHYIAETFPDLTLYRDEGELFNSIAETFINDDVHPHIEIERHTTQYRMLEMLKKIDNQ